MPSRRTLLAACGSTLAVVAGCTATPGRDGTTTGERTTGGDGSTDDDGTTGTGTPTGDRTPTPTGDGDPRSIQLSFDESYSGETYAVALDDPEVTHSVFVRSTDLFNYESHRGIAVQAAENHYVDGAGQLLFLDVDVDPHERAPPADAFALEAGESSVRGWSEWGQFDWRRDPLRSEHTSAYGYSPAGEDATRMGFLPRAPVDGDPKLVHDPGEQRVEWSLPEDVVTSLAATPPEWDLRDLTVDWEDNSVTIAVANDGGAAVFRVGVNVVGTGPNSEPHSFRVPGGAVRSRTYELPSPQGGRPESYAVSTPVGDFRGPGPSDGGR